MNFWSIAIYGVAAVIAIQGLIALMTAHRQAALRRCFAEEARRSEAAKHQPEPAAANKAQKSKAA